MKMFLVMALGFFFTMDAHAYRGFNGTQNIGLYSDVQCSTGLTCAQGNASSSVRRMAISVTPGARTSLVAATAVTITAAQCGSTFYNTAAVVIKLPLASTVPGCTLHFVTLNASNFDVNPDDADQILVSTNAIGDAIRNATLGNSIVLRAVGTLGTAWAPVAIQGTWTDIN